MPKPPASPRLIVELAPGQGSAGLEQSVRRLAESGEWQLEARLPTTRQLGERFGISNASVSRLLQRLDDEGVIWRRDNGRYYPAGSERLYGRPKTYACLLRKLEHWSRVYLDVMSGFSRAFGEGRAAMLFVHNETLVRHHDTGHPPVHAGVAAQTKALEQFLAAPPESVAGLLLDEIWRDEVLAAFGDRLGPAVVTCRPTTVRDVSSVSVDFTAGGLAAVGHLWARGYEEILIAVPFSNVVSVDLMIAAVRAAAETLGKPVPATALCSASTPAARERLVARVQTTKRRVGIFCPEDNISRLLRQELIAAGIDLPAQAGVLSGMGTDLVRSERISSLRIDYEAIGRTAAEILTGKEVRHVVLPVTLDIAETT